MNAASRPRVLVVEDDESIAALERDYLEAADFSVTVVESGEEALGHLGGGAATVDAVVLDVMLPGIDGFRVLREIRARWDLPVIMVTARQEDVDTVRGLGLGADDYVAKPFSPAQLVARVKAHLARHERLTGDTSRPGTSRGTIEVGGVRVERRTRRAWVDGSEVQLTAKEFSLLAVLLEQPDWVFTREELYDRVWGEESFGDQSTVTVHVRKLREKIERDPAAPTRIVTVWGVGYRFAPGGAA